MLQSIENRCTDGAKVADDGLGRARILQPVEYDPHEERIGRNIVELLSVENVATGLEQIRGHRGDDARPVGACKGQDKSLCEHDDLTAESAAPW